MKRLFIDIETSPNIVLSWRVGWKIKIDAENIIKERAIICICYKWQHEKTVRFLKWDKDQNDKKMVAEIVKVMNQADEIVGQNILDFDLSWIKTRAAFHHIGTNPYYKIVDTLKFSRRNMYFNSNRLDYLGKYLGVGGKIKTEFNLWKKVLLDNDKHALDTMVKYCKRDVVLLENVYKRLAEHMPPSTHAGVLAHNGKWTCPYCASKNVKVNKTNVSATGMIKQQMQCRKPTCGRYYTISGKVYQDYKDAKGYA
jgi:hypothetical protein